MNKGILCAVAGGILLLIALIKLSVIGYYPDELLPFAAIGIGGALLLAVGSKLYRNARSS